MTDSVPLLAGHRLGSNPYLIKRFIAKGGFGAVYLAEDMLMQGRLCVIKENFDQSSDSREQFRVEATTLSILSHPHLVRVTDKFEEPNHRQYVVMDYIDGEDLEEILNRSPNGLPEKQVLHWMDQILDAIAYCHAFRPKVIHRDIKPANIRIRQGDNKAIVVDFGIAKIGGGLTQVAARGVSPGYAPPEQYGTGTDTYSDIYALGATLYHLLTGRTPPPSVDIAYSGVVLDRPRALNPLISSGTEEVILRAMQLNPRDRYQAVVPMRQALQGIRVCPSCATTNRASARFCQACGRSLATSMSQYPIIRATAVDKLRQIAGTSIVRIIGEVEEVKRSQTQNGDPYVFVNFGDFRHGCFRAVLWADALQRFEAKGIMPESHRKRFVCVTGRVSLYQGQPQIEVGSPEDVEVLTDQTEAEARLKQGQAQKVAISSSPVVQARPISQANPSPVVPPKLAMPASPPAPPAPSSIMLPKLLMPTPPPAPAPFLSALAKPVAPSSQPQKDAASQDVSPKAVAPPLWPPILGFSPSAQPKPNAPSPQRLPPASPEVTPPKSAAPPPRPVTPVSSQAALPKPAAAPHQIPPPYQLIPGMAARTVGELIKHCEDNWDRAVEQFYQGDFEAWLRKIGQQLALADEARRIAVSMKNTDTIARSEGFAEWLLLAGHSGHYAVTISVLDFAPIGVGETSAATLIITNSGTRYVSGVIEAQVSWLSAREPRFGCKPKGTSKVEIVVDTSHLMPGTHVEKQAFLVKARHQQLDVPARLTVLPPVLRVAPIVLRFGEIRTRAPVQKSLEIKNTGAGYLVGKVHSCVSWLSVPSPSFKCHAGKSVEVGIVCDPKAVSSDRASAGAALMIECPYAPPPVYVSATAEIVLPCLTADPAPVRFGDVISGKVQGVTLTVTCSNSLKVSFSIRSLVSWLIVPRSQISCVTDAPTRVLIRADTGQLPLGELEVPSALEIEYEAGCILLGVSINVVSRIGG